MNRTLLITAAAVAALSVAGAADAAKMHKQSAGAYAEPSQPIAYGNLNSYLKASPKQRAGKDWSATAQTGQGANAAAITPAAPAPAVAAPSPDAAAPAAAVNPAAPATNAPNVTAPATPAPAATPDTTTPPNAPSPSAMPSAGQPGAPAPAQ